MTKNDIINVIYIIIKDMTINLFNSKESRIFV